MLRHDHPRQQSELMFAASVAQAFQELSLNGVVLEQRQIVITGKSQIARLLRDFVSFPMNSLSHENILNIRASFFKSPSGGVVLALARTTRADGSPTDTLPFPWFRLAAVP